MIEWYSWLSFGKVFSNILLWNLKKQTKQTNDNNNNNKQTASKQKEQKSVEKCCDIVTHFTFFGFVLALAVSLT